MTLETDFNNHIEHSLSQLQQRPWTLADVARVVDLTHLKREASSETIRDLASRAARLETAAICVYPDQLDGISVPVSIKKAFVVNFPAGNDSITSCIQALESGKAYGGQEADIVFPYQQFLGGNPQDAYHTIKQLIDHSHALEMTTKVILETEALDDLDTIYHVSQNLIALGTGFVKSSTGLYGQGVTLKHAYTMLKAVVDSQSATGIKFSGGIRTLDAANQFMMLSSDLINKPIDASWFRIGASGLLDNLS